ncbi:MAG: hypothetical protein J7K21_05470 [Desulfurococcales archaeon]|nr:hypothetical protein [Desulfurococcales archaeon]
MKELDAVSIVENISRDPSYREYLLKRYRSRDHAIWCWNRAKDLVLALKDPSVLRKFSYRRAVGVLEAVPSIKEYAKLIYGIELGIDTKLLRKFLPPRKIQDITNAILEIELKETGEAKSIIQTSLEYVNTILARDSKYKIPVITNFFTGLRPSEVKYMLENWNKLRKIKLNGVYLVVLNYDRGKKKAYITLLPEKLYSIIDNNKPYVLSEYWNDHVRHKYGINLYIFRKSFIAITSDLLDDAERDLLEGRLRSIQVKHYVKHIRLIAQKYLEAFKPYLYLLDSLSKN